MNVQNPNRSGLLCPPCFLLFLEYSVVLHITASGWRQKHPDNRGTSLERISLALAASGHLKCTKQSHMKWSEPFLLGTISFKDVAPHKTHVRFGQYLHFRAREVRIRVVTGLLRVHSCGGWRDSRAHLTTGEQKNIPIWLTFASWGNLIGVISYHHIGPLLTLDFGFQPWWGRGLCAVG